MPGFFLKKNKSWVGQFKKWRKGNSLCYQGLEQERPSWEWPKLGWSHLATSGIQSMMLMEIIGISTAINVVPITVVNQELPVFYCFISLRTLNHPENAEINYFTKRKWISLKKRILQILVKFISTAESNEHRFRDKINTMTLWEAIFFPVLFSQVVSFEINFYKCFSSKDGWVLGLNLFHSKQAMSSVLAAGNYQ